MKTKYKLISALSLLSASAIGTGIVNKLIKFHAVSRKLLSSDSSWNYSWRLGKIKYMKKGSGTPLLLIHDLNSSASSYEWNKISKALSEKHNLFLPDLIGCGLSEKPDMTYTNFLFVQMISDFIRSKIGKRCNVITSGASSSIIIMAAKLSPELFDKIILISPESPENGMKVPGKRAKTYKFIFNLPIIGELLYNISLSKKNIGESFSKKNFYHPYRFSPMIKDIYYESAHLGESPKSLHASLICNYTKVNIKPAVSDIDNSIFIIYGENDSEGKLSAKEFSALNYSIESTSIPNCKKYPQIEAPDQLLELLDIYL
ncbi:MAG: alpha/beta hydrolase [Johnsonella sp.]|nr:alpha/beta hydrolase [Johnsonella sp.]